MGSIPRLPYFCVYLFLIFTILVWTIAIDFIHGIQQNIKELIRKSMVNYLSYVLLMNLGTAVSIVSLHAFLSYLSTPLVLTYLSKPLMVAYLSKPLMVDYLSTPLVLTYLSTPLMVAYLSYVLLMNLGTAGSIVGLHAFISWKWLIWFNILITFLPSYKQIFVSQINLPPLCYQFLSSIRKIILWKFKKEKE